MLTLSLHSQQDCGGTNLVFYSLADFDVIGEQVLQAEGITEGDFPLLQIVDPVFVNEVVSELPTEGANVAEEGRADQAVSQEPDSLLLQFLQVNVPSGKHGEPTYCFISIGRI